MKYINEFDHKAHLFIDMDGTLATWQQTACFEDLLQENYFRDLPPYQEVVDAIKILCKTRPELDVFTLSAYIDNIHRHYSYFCIQQSRLVFGRACFFVYSNKERKKAMIKLTKPILIEIDEGYSVPVKDFRQYARCMMYPDPTGIDMSEELDDLVTNAINEGKTTLHAAFDKLVKRDTNGRIDYSYSDGFDGFVYGQELLCFCDVKTAIERLELR